MQQALQSKKNVVYGCWTSIGVLRVMRTYYNSLPVDSVRLNWHLTNRTSFPNLSQAKKQHLSRVSPVADLTLNRLESRSFIFLKWFSDSKFYISEKTENLNLEAVQAHR